MTERRCNQRLSGSDAKVHIYVQFEAILMYYNVSETTDENGRCIPHLYLYKWLKNISPLGYIHMEAEESKRYSSVIVSEMVTFLIVPLYFCTSLFIGTERCSVSSMVVNDMKEGSIYSKIYYP